MPVPDHKVKIWIANPHKTIARSTDHEYVHKRFVQLANEFPIQFLINRHIVGRIYRDAIFTLDRIKLLFKRNTKRLKKDPYSDAYICIPPQDCDLIFSYGGFPWEIGRKSGKPIICEQTFAHGGVIDETVWTKHIRQNRRLYVETSTIIITPSLESMRVFKLIFPDYSNKIRYLPYYLPHLKKFEGTDLDEKYKSIAPIKFLFVGKEARRKGLDNFIQAYSTLTLQQKDKLQVTVISKFLDGRVNLPEEFIYESFVDKIETKFKEAHVLVFLTKQEAYGLVLVEAMAAGCNVLTTHHPIQRSIMNNQGGWFVDPYNNDEITSALKEILNASKDELRTNALVNYQNYQEDKSPDIVGKGYFNMFHSVFTMHANA